MATAVAGTLLEAAPVTCVRFKSPQASVPLAKREGVRPTTVPIDLRQKSRFQCDGLASSTIARLCDRAG
jgi:hypothetical protein